MKSDLRTPISSEKSSTTTDSLQSETRGTVYFPGCRKDANCNCEICIASINATLDLIPRSIHGSSRTTLSNPKRKFPRSPVSFTAPPDLLSPKSTARNRPTNAASPPSDSTGISNSEKKLQSPNHGLNTRAFLARFVLGLILVCGLDYGFSSRISRVLKPQLSPNLVNNLSEKSWKFEGLNAKFVFLENELNAAIVGDKVSSCSSDDSLWKINQDGLLLNSRCVLFKSMAEEVSIWGWPLQTAGMLASQSSSTSFSIISGNVAEWVSREANYMSRKGNGSWTQGKWSYSIVQMDPNTWILEYRRSVLLENTGLVSGVLEFLKMMLTREFRRVVQGFWLPEIRHPHFIHRVSSPPSMKHSRVHPIGPRRTSAARNGPSQDPISQTRLRRLPHLFGNVLELPFRSDANVTIEERPDLYKFVAAVGDLGSECITARAVEIIPGVIKIVVRDDDEENEGVELLMDRLEMDAWRFRFPSSTQPEMVAAECVDGELIVTVPKSWELEGGDSWSSSRLVLV